MEFYGKDARQFAELGEIFNREQNFSCRIESGKPSLRGVQER